MKIDRQPGKVTVLGLAQKRGRLWILRPEMISERCQHCHELVAPIRQREHAEAVDDGCYVGEGWKQPLQIALVDTTRQEGDDSKQFSPVGSQFLEHRRGQRYL